jgi:hypothetical protein
MRFDIYDEQARVEWSKLTGSEVGRVVYVSHDFYLRHRDRITAIQDAAGARYAEVMG